jgi:hypothetical protein
MPRQVELTVHSDEEAAVTFNPQVHEMVETELPDGNISHYYRLKAQTEEPSNAN